MPSWLNSKNRVKHLWLPLPRSREARKKAEAAAQKELDEVKKQIQIEKEEAIRDIRRQVALLSVDIAEKVIRKNLNEDSEQMAMIDRMLDEVLDSKN